MGFLDDNSGNLAASRNPLGAAPGGISPDVLANLAGPGGINPEGAQSMPENVLAAISGLNGGSANQTAAPRRKRVSVLDIIGGLADAGAEFGGVEGGYRAGIERRQQQERQANEDSWQEKFNAQKLQQGQNEIQNATTARFGQAARGLSAVLQNAGPEGLQRVFPMVAQTLGLSPDEQEFFGQAIQADPENTLAALAEASTNSNASQPKELAIYKVLQRQDAADGGSRATQYLDTVTKGQLDPYQQMQIALRQADDARADRKDARDQRNSDRSYRLDVRKLKNDENKAAAKAAAGGTDTSALDGAEDVLNDMQNSLDRAYRAGSITGPDSSFASRAKALAYDTVPFAERLANPEGFSAREDLDRLRTVGLTSLLPLLGGLKIGSKNIDAAKELETWRKAIMSATDYPSANRALNGIRTRINQLRKDAASAPASSSEGSSGGRIRLKPRGTSSKPAAKPSVSNW